LTKYDAELCKPFSCAELTEAVNRINMDSAPGPDGFTPRIVKDLFSFWPFFVFFLMFANFCFVAGWVPAAWLCSIIFVLYKGKGDPRLCDSFCGIALCSILGKVYERLLLFRLQKWWRASWIFHISQFGFRAGSSTIDAVFVLRNLVQCICRVHRVPLHAVFIDIKKAFPSVSRPALFERLTALGVPWPLVNAIRAFYICNRTCLRVGNYLSRFFVVTCGLLEGSILSPMIFSLVIAVVWSVVCPGILPGSDDFVFRFDDVWIIAFADDLVILSPSREKLASVLANLDVELSRLNLFLNLVKTEVMTFLPRGHTSILPLGSVMLRSHSFAEVKGFNYLGVFLSSTGSLSQHVEIVSSRAKVSAIRTSDLIHDLSISNLERLRCYFNAFVRAQFYGLELIPFSRGFLDKVVAARNTFVRRVFRLPPGSPSDLFYVLFSSVHPALLCLRQRFSFFKRASRHDLHCVPDAFFFDATVLLDRSCGWFYESFQFYKEICHDARLSDFDFVRDVGNLLSITADEDMYSFSFVRASRTNCMSFFRLFSSVNALRGFRHSLGTLPLSYQHVVLAFSSNQLRWCFLSYASLTCPLCRRQSWSWEHFFSCPFLAPSLSSRGLDFSLFRSHVQASRWKVVFREIAHVLLVWSFVLRTDASVSLKYDVDLFRCMMREI
jgi:hypothetical protein